MRESLDANVTVSPEEGCDDLVSGLSVSGDQGLDFPGPDLFWTTDMRDRNRGQLQRAGLGGRGDPGQRLQQQPTRRAAGLGSGAMEGMKFI
jgi:hypothetical protein